MSRSILRTYGYCLSIAFISFLSSCSSSKNITDSGNAVSDNSVCKSVPLNEAEPFFRWMNASFSATPEEQMKLPTAYKVFLISEKEINTYISYIKSEPSASFSFAAPVSGDLGCQYFTMKRSGTMSPELEKKYPDLISLQGTANTNKGNTIQLDFNPEGMNGSITWDGNVYIIKPWLQSGSKYYLVYNKKNAREYRGPVDENNQPLLNQQFLKEAPRSTR